MKGARIRYNAAELAFVESRCAMPRRALHDAFKRAFGRTDVRVADIKALCTRNGWSTGRRRWTPEDDSLLRELYPDVSSAEVARRLGRPLETVYRRAYRLGLSKSEAYLASPAACRLRRGDNVGAAHRFKKGGVPANKGKTMPFHPNSASTRFKKGTLPHNTKWAGYERVSKDGYVEISVEETNPHTGFGRRFVLKHKWLWEKANGPVPNGMALKCLGDRLNTDPSNWELVPRSLLPRLNGKFGRGYDRAPTELKPTILAIAKLEHAVSQAVKR